MTNRPGDAAYVEQTLSDGAGLLSGGGASISNVFSGDAESAVLTFSRVTRDATRPLAHRPLFW